MPEQCQNPSGFIGPLSTKVESKKILYTLTKQFSKNTTHKIDIKITKELLDSNWNVLEDIWNIVLHLGKVIKSIKSQENSLSNIDGLYRIIK